MVGRKWIPYKWLNGFGVEHTINNIRSGNYYYSIQDSKGCSLNDTVVISEPDSILIDFNSTTSNCNDSIGKIKLFTNGGTSPFKYYWVYNGSKADSLVNIPSGEYQVVVIDANNCKKVKIIVEDSDGPGVNIVSQSNLTCFGDVNGSVVIEGNDANSPFLYKWLTISNDTSSQQINLRAGQYPVTVVNSLGCSTTDTVSITQPSEFGVNLSITNTPCGNIGGNNCNTIWWDKPLFLFVEKLY